MQIGGHDVELITRDSAKVGCTNVTRAEAKALLEEMDKAEKDYNFEIANLGSVNAEYINFSVKHTNGGWISTHMNPDAGEMLADGATGYGNKAAYFCMRRSYAEKFMKFLAEKLNYAVYQLAPKEVRWQCSFNSK